VREALCEPDEPQEESMNNIEELCDQVRQTAYNIHVYHGHGHLEKVYENALVHRLRKLGLEVQQQHAIQVFDADGTLIGDYFADLFVDKQVVVELKTAKSLSSEHEAQILGYLKSARVEHGLLINIGSYKFEIRKFIRSKPPNRGIVRGAVAFFSVLFAFFAVK
jgi:GxxExxY protein